LFRFSAFELFRFRLLAYTGATQLTIAQNFLCGIATGVAESLVIVTPMETIKTYLIHDQRKEKPKYTGMGHAIRDIIKTEGTTYLLIEIC